MYSKRQGEKSFQKNIMKLRPEGKWLTGNQVRGFKAMVSDKINNTMEQREVTDNEACLKLFDFEKIKDRECPE